jgi:hypothetical protein
MSFTWQDDPTTATATLTKPAPETPLDPLDPLDPHEPLESHEPVESHEPRASHEPDEQTGRYQITLGQVTSYLLLTQRKAHVHEGTLEELERNYRATLLHNLALGWWGLPFGLIWTPIWLSRNRAARKALRARAAA